MANAWIMVVDDDVMNLQNAGDILREAGYRVATARSGKDLLAFTEKHRPDLILLDILMPEMNGFETFRKLREAEAGRGEKEVPVIFLTGENDSESETKGLTLGASDYVRKPFNRDILLRRIQNTIQNSRTIENLSEEAVTDRLTGFLNKAGTLKKLSVLCRSERGMLTILDLDSFKLVNDIYGHDMGDRVLKGFSEILCSNTEPRDIRGRVGGDEFMLFLFGVTEEKVLSDLSARVNRQIQEMAYSLMGDDMQIPLGVSFGAVFVPQQEKNYEAVVKKADRALYNVKKNGKHGIDFYREGIAKDEEKTVASVDELRRISQVLDERNVSNSALWLEPDAFTVVYRFMLRYIRSYRGLAYSALVTLQKKDESLDDAEFAGMTEKFGEVINHALRKSDIMMQNRPNQYYLLLPELSEENAESVFARIRNTWRETDHSDKAVIRFDAEKISVPDIPVEDKRRK